MDDGGAMLQPRRAAAVGVGAVDDERAARVAARPRVELEGVAVGRERTKALAGLRHALEATEGIGEVAAPGGSTAPSIQDGSFEGGWLEHLRQWLGA